MSKEKVVGKKHRKKKTTSGRKQSISKEELAFIIAAYGVERY